MQLNQCRENYSDLQYLLKLERSKEYTFNEFSRVCGQFQDYKECTENVLADGYCFSATDNLVLKVFPVVCAEDSREAARQTLECTTEKLHECTGSDFLYRLENDEFLTANGHVCEIIGNLKKCVIHVAATYCNESVAEFLEDVLNAIEEANFCPRVTVTAVGQERFDFPVYAWEWFGLNL